MFSCEQQTSMILRNLRVFSQNVQKNKFLTNTLLEINKDFDIILIQEPLCLTICSIPSSLNNEGEIIVGVLNHLNWITFSRNSSNDNDYSCIILYINIYLTSLWFSLQKDIFNHRNICCFSFFNNSKIFFLLNIYLDSNQSTLKYLKDTKANIYNVLIMTGDFNDTFNLFFSYPTHSVPTRYLDNSENSNPVINLMFLRPNSSELDNHSILPELWYPLNHVLQFRGLRVGQ